MKLVFFSLSSTCWTGEGSWHARFVRSTQKALLQKKKIQTRQQGFWSLTHKIKKNGSWLSAPPGTVFIQPVYFFRFRNVITLYRRCAETLCNADGQLHWLNMWPLQASFEQKMFGCVRMAFHGLILARVVHAGNVSASRTSFSRFVLTNICGRLSEFLTSSLQSCRIL